MKIEEYKNIYKEEVCNLILNIQNSEFDIPITLEGQPDLLDIKGFYQKGLGNFWLALIDNEVVGTISLLDISNGNVALRKMFVKEEFRGASYQVAKTLLNTLFEYSKNKKIKSIYLGTTEKFLAAHRFYEKNGFVQILKEQLPKEFPIMKVDTKFYKFDL